MLRRVSRLASLSRTRARQSANYGSAADELSKGIMAARSLIRKMKPEPEAKPSAPPAPKKPLEIIDEDEEPMFPVKKEEKIVKKRSPAPKKQTPKVPQVIYPDNIDLEISPQIKKAVSKKGKVSNPQVRDPEEEEDDAIGSIHPNFNEHITKMLAELGQIEKTRGELYKAKAYSTAVQSLKKYPKRVESGAEAAKLPGVGQKIAAKIQQIIDTQGLKQLDIARADPNIIAVQTLSRVSGIGPVLARKLVFEDGIKTIEQLKAMGDTLTHHQQVGLKYMEAFEKRIPRDEMDKWNEIIVDAAYEVEPDLIATICGSYRRKLHTSGDVDILMMHPTYKKVHKDADEDAPFVSQLVRKLKDRGYIVEDMAMGPLKYMGVCKLKSENSIPRRLDIKLFPVESYAGGLMHFTGSAEYNRQMRARALELGYRLNEYGLHHRNLETGETMDLIPTMTEHEICEILKVPYRDPAERSLS